MIVKNEAHCLADCLDSVRAIANEIVIADTGSTDDTVAIAQRYGASIIHIQWRNDFAWARNQALAAATGDWLLHMDADEVLDPAGAQRIRELLDADDGSDAIELTLANYCNDTRAWRWQAVASDDPMARGYAGYIGVPLLRLFRNHRGFEYREPVHENITESVIERGGVIRSEPIIIHHYGYGDSARSKDKTRIYHEIAQRKVHERPHDPKAWLDLAETAFGCGDAQLTETACCKAIELAPLDAGSNMMLANLLLNRGDLDEAHAILERLEQTGNDLPHIGTALGAIAYKQGRLDEARAQLERVLEQHPRSIQAMLYLARVHDISGHPDQARQCLQRACNIAPNLAELRARLKAHALRVEGEGHFKTGNVSTALQHLVQALKLDVEDPIIHTTIGHVLVALGEPQKAEESYQRARQLTSQAV